jgi:TRAP transporter TAXI family solute receptor
MFYKYLRVAAVAFVAGLSLAAGAASATENLPATHQERVEIINRGSIGMVSGGMGGTYIRIASDLQAVLDGTDELRVLPIVGKGSVQNITDLLYLRGIDVAIVQSDVLAYLKRTNAIPDIENRVAYITKLYNEEFHLVARRDITDIRQLAGKTVNFGPEGSGTAMTAQVVFDSLGLKVMRANEPYQDALQKVKSGEIDAMVYVAGKPASIFSNLTEADGLHIVPVPYDRELQDAYLPASITSADYAGLVGAGGSTDTVAVGAVMAVFNWKERTGRYYSTRAFVNAFMDNFPKLLEEPRHAKWAEVNLAAELPGWQRYAVAEEWLKNNPNQPVSAASRQEQRMAELVNAFEQFLKSRPEAATLAEEDREQLFNQFLAWTREQGTASAN